MDSEQAALMIVLILKFVERNFRGKTSSTKSTKINQPQNLLTLPYATSSFAMLFSLDVSRLKGWKVRDQLICNL